tara:strand:+ start:1050 stop:1376 length:327 start_codon:yes stop_codon:yes gene_type:complete
MEDNFKPWSERNDDDSVDDLIAAFAEAMQTNDGTTIPAEDVVDRVLEKAWGETEDNGVLGNFVFIGEVISPKGNGHLMVVTSDNLPHWIARGMIATADDHLSYGIEER